MFARLLMMILQAIVSNIASKKISEYYKTKFKFYSSSKKTSVILGVLGVLGTVGWTVYEFFPEILHLFFF
jgi:hypothetical protein